MSNADTTPQYTAPPAGPDPLKAPQFKSSNTTALRLGAGLLLTAVSLYLFLRPPGPPPRASAGSDEPLSAEEALPGLPLPAGGARQPAAPASAEGLQPQSLTPPSGGLQDENITPPLPGLLMSRITLDTVSYTGQRPGPAALAKETAEDSAGCKAGDMFKCMRLGGRYFAGYGVERDAVRGFALINKACAGGIAEACTMQGIMQTSGHGTPVDVPAGIALYDKACAAGDMMGCTMMASQYLDGKTVPGDIPRGLALLRKACEAKLGAACSFLGVFYAEGKFVRGDAAEAERLLNEACELNEKSACQLYQQQVQKRLAAGTGR